MNKEQKIEIAKTIFNTWRLPDKWVSEQIGLGRIYWNIDDKKSTWFIVFKTVDGFVIFDKILLGKINTTR